MDKQAAAKEALSIVHQVSQLLETGLDKDALAVCVALIEQGVDPEALSAVVKELRRDFASASASA
ncbi:hypothetical protein BCR33DRAFT_720336 [Rhizoclosmatium globosum]|uniref:Mitotic-spindle organizing protein 1 n=1 Tax=Rhizoclosmatium globosum TaxID=329046 RepID=A0A1Y2BWR0_9FUNG|nr:hypothetical protein BCR33DRAFT_720336 [Rhizoclosmatium globosum]|eukprot:ORY39087.1 hypothetical protein BCR33DRAFT_720336 [Rhizoclosmatium globosum]